MRIEIIAVGDEVLRGETVEDNASWLAVSLTASGIPPVRISTLPDDQVEIGIELSAAAARSDLVIVTGGLGPTVDDVTRQAAIEAFGGEEEIRGEIIESIERRFAEIGYEMPEGYRDLARIPQGAELVDNHVGAAPGLALRTGGCLTILLPGVPAEMKDMFEREVVPRLAESACDRRKTLRIFGLPETVVEERLEEVLGKKDLENLSIISSPAGISVYLPSDLDSLAEEKISESLGDHLFGEGRDRLEEIIVGMLRTRGLTLAVAESLTGGMLSSMIVSVPGASETFLEGHVTYSNVSKIRILGVDAGIIEEYGAVSEEVCRQMAEGARKISGTDLALSTTGIAGPGGATADKAAGLCYMAIAGAGGADCLKKQMAGDRSMVRLRASCICLDMLRRRILDDGGNVASERGSGRGTGGR